MLFGCFFLKVLLQIKTENHTRLQIKLVSSKQMHMLILVVSKQQKMCYKQISILMYMRLSKR